MTLPLLKVLLILVTLYNGTHSYPPHECDTIEEAEVTRVVQEMTYVATAYLRCTEDCNNNNWPIISQESESCTCNKTVVTNRNETLNESATVSRCCEGWVGSNCTLCTLACENGASCEHNTTTRKAYCVCLEGYNGELCQEAICENCVHGTCTAPPNTCDCDAGYGGENCTTPLCEPECVVGQGHCAAVNTCVCYPDWKGPDCATPMCGLACLEGVCSNNHTSGSEHCDCYPGWHGHLCDSAICVYPCLNGGTCTEPDICTCTDEYTGLQCRATKYAVLPVQSGVYENSTYSRGEVWEQLTCKQCECGMDGSTQCEDLTCDTVCDQGELVYEDGECCPVCRPTIVASESCALTGVKVTFNTSCGEAVVTLNTCSGTCDSTTVLTAKPPYFTQECRCCQPVISSLKIGTHVCESGVGTAVYTYKEAESCSCDVCTMAR